MTPRTRTVLLGAAASAVLFLAMALLVADVGAWRSTEPANATRDANDLGGLTDSLFGADVLAFEVLGILLTAAMIGALVIARPLEAPSDESRYSHPTQQQVAETDAVSDPRTADLRTEAQR